MIKAYIGVTTLMTAYAMAVSGCSAGLGGHLDHRTTLPLRVGVYVAESQTCSEPANAGILSFDGQGLNGPHTHDCEMSISSQQANLFTYRQRCINAGIGDGLQSVVSGFVRVENDMRFYVVNESEASVAFNYCEPSALPPEIPVPRARGVTE
jgi:hypothetical protein